MACGYIQIIPFWVAVLTDNIELLEENLFSLIVINWCIESKNILAVIFIIKVEQQRKIIETSLPPMPFGWQIVAVSLFNHILDISKPDSKGVGNLESGFFYENKHKVRPTHISVFLREIQVQ